MQTASKASSSAYRLTGMSTCLILDLKRFEQHLNRGEISEAAGVIRSLGQSIRREDVAWLRLIVSRGLLPWLKEIGIEDPETKAYSLSISEAELAIILQKVKRDGPVS